jgi:translation initiation factor 2 subunit 2
MDTYEKLLEKAYKKIKVVESSRGRFEVPKVTGQVQGKNTLITNIHSIADYLRRQAEHIAKFLQKELAVAGKLDKNKLALKTKLNSIKVNSKVEMYTREFVLCTQCGKPDTEIITDKGIKLKHCLACGAKNPIKYRL